MKKSMYFTATIENPDIVQCYCRPHGRAHVINKRGSTYSVRYRRSGNFVWKCVVTDNEGLTGSSSITTTVVDLKGKSMLLLTDTNIIE